jgi:hypothetical protein
MGGETSARTVFRSEYRSTGERKRNVGTVEYVAVSVFSIWQRSCL